MSFDTAYSELLMPCHLSERQNYNVKVTNKSFKNVAKVQIFGSDGDKSELHS
jgi:hypothetical protein